MAKERILVADDDVGTRFGIRDFLELQGCTWWPHCSEVLREGLLGATLALVRPRRRT
jgi:hypothetical protein